MTRTQVAIVGAGPAGLVLSHLLARAGIESIVLESRSREYVERRVRAGVLEHGTVDLLVSTGVGERLQREGMVHHGIELRFDGEQHRIDLTALSGGRSITIYGQQEVVKDLIAARLAAGGRIEFEAVATAIDPEAPLVRYDQGGEPHDLHCDYVVGCDGSHGVARDALLRAGARVYEREYPFAWLGILAEAPPSTQELIYAYHDRGFALHSMRSPTLSRFYLQVRPEEQVGMWPEERIWSELRTRLGIPELMHGPILELGITPMRSMVVEPMQRGRLFLAGDAAHIVPPTGAKGLNLAVADVRILAAALTEWYATGRLDGPAGYSESCLRRVWRAEHFSWWMTAMLHRFEDGDGFDARLQLSQLRYVTSSRAAGASLAENYVGLPDASQ